MDQEFHKSSGKVSDKVAVEHWFRRESKVWGCVIVDFKWRTYLLSCDQEVDLTDSSVTKTASAADRGQMLETDFPSLISSFTAYILWL